MPSASRECNAGAGESQVRAWQSHRDFLHYEGMPSLNPLDVNQNPLRGRLPFYRPAETNLSFLEVEHAGVRFITLKTPHDNLTRLLSSEGPAAGSG